MWRFAKRLGSRQRRDRYQRNILLEPSYTLELYGADALVLDLDLSLVDDLHLRSIDQSALPLFSLLLALILFLGFELHLEDSECVVRRPPGIIGLQESDRPVRDGHHEAAPFDGSRSNQL